MTAAVGFALPYLGTFWTGVVLTVVVIVFLLWLLVAWDDHFSKAARMSKWRRRIAEEEARYSGELQDYSYRGETEDPGTGVLLCDFVDESDLASIAQQRGLDPQPARTERMQSQTASGALGGGKLPGLLTRQKGQEERSVFETPDDPNALLGKVMNSLSKDLELLRDLDVLPQAVPLDSAALDEMLNVARGGEAAQATEAIETLRERWIATRKADEFEAAASASRFVLVENQWAVIHDHGSVTLRLAFLKSGPYSGPDERVNMPGGLAVEARLAVDSLTERGQGRFGTHDSRVAAGVFASVSGWDPASETLLLAPIAVFARYGS